MRVMDVVAGVLAKAD